MTLNPRARRHWVHSMIGTIGLSVAWSATIDAAELDDRYTFSIPSQSLSAALLTFSEQARIQVMTASADLSGLTSPGLTGESTVGEALETLLRGTGLKFRMVSSDAIAVEPIDARSEDSATRVPRGVPEILVTGSRVLNMDIRRDRDDPQPYTIFDQTQIADSGAASVEDFLKTRLTMNTQATTLSQQTAGAFANNTSINLRGLGAGQTLILVDGRRQPGFPSYGNSGQADLNGIPLAAIERIEVLPTTASGIYGGSATGGVVNVVLRRDYEGAEISVKYEDSFKSDAPNQRVDLAAGFNLFDGKTNVLVAGSYMEGEQPAYGDRNFWRRGRSAVLANTNNDYRALDLGTTPVMGATTNVRSVDGSNLVLDNGTPLGSAITHVPTGYAGLSSGDGGAALVGQAGSFNIDSPNTAQTIGGSRTRLGQAPELQAFSVTVRHEITPSISAFLQGSASKSMSRFALDALIGQSSIAFTMPADAPGNPFQQVIQVIVPSSSEERSIRSETQNRGISAGLIFKLPRDWVSGLDYTWSRSEFDFVNPFTGVTSALGAAVLNGEVDVFRDNGTYPINLSPYLSSFPPVPGHFDSTLRNASLRVAGPLWELPGGPLQLTMLAEYREERLGEGLTGNINNNVFSRYYYPSRSQSVESAYAELRMPWVSARNRLPGVEALELQVAVRRDEYETVGSNASILIPADGVITGIVRNTNEVSSVDPTIALLYQPLRDVTLRGSYGTGFLPPGVGQVVPGATFPGAAGGIDPLRGNTTASGYEATSGGNPNLDAEESESWSMGFILTPRAVPGLRLSLDYTNIKKTDNIASLNTDMLIAYFPERITRGPNLPGDPPGWAGPIIAIDATLVNVARAEVSAYDLQLDYRFSTPYGTFTPFVYASRQTHFLQQFLPNGPIVDNVGITSANPPKLKGNAGLNWRHGDWSAGWTVRYIDSYTAGTTVVVNQRQGNGGKVASQTYHDLFATYRFAPTRSNVLADAEITLGIKNLFDEEPPFDANNIINGYYSTFGDPRLASYWLNVRKRF